MEKQPARISKMFDQIAGRYDLMNRILTAGLDRRWRAAAVNSLQLTGSETVVDLCTGTADMAVALARDIRGAEIVIGVDFAREMLRHGTDKLRASELSGRVQLVRGDATKLPISAGSAHAATIAFGIRNVSDVRATLAEVGRIVKSGGRVAILEFSLPTRLPFLWFIYSWYFRRLLPWLGRTVSGHSSAYSYLPESIGAFYSPAEFRQLLVEEGFTDVRVVPVQFGIVHLYEARTL